MSTPSTKTLTLILSLIACLFVVAVLLRSRPLAGTSGSAVNSATRSTNELELKEAYGKLPMAFEVNQGQTDATVKYLARGSGYSLFLTPNEAVLSLSTASRVVALEGEADSARQRLRQHTATGGTLSSTLRMKVMGADAHTVMSGDGELPGKSNYFIGQDPRKWHKGIQNFAKVGYQAIYPGIDLTYYGNQRQLEYDFVIHPGSDPGKIALVLEGADGVSIDETGDLVLTVAGREVRQQRPFAYQEVNGARSEIVSRFVLHTGNQIGFELGQYDVTEPLVIDPVIVYSTYFGGTGADTATAITVNGAGEAFITGTTASANFPGTSLLGASTSNGDAYVAKLNAAGTAIVFASYFGGNNPDLANAITLDQSGNIYVAGSTQSFNFPTAGTPYQATKMGGPQRPEQLLSLADALNVSVEDLVGTNGTKKRGSGPTGKMKQLFEAASRLPRSQQQKITALLEPFIAHHAQR